MKKLLLFLYAVAVTNSAIAGAVNQYTNAPGVNDTDQMYIYEQAAPHDFNVYMSQLKAYTLTNAPGAALTNLPANPALYPQLNQSTTGTAAQSGTATHATYYDGVIMGDVTGPMANSVVGSALHVPATNMPAYVLQTNAIGSTVDAFGAAAAVRASALQSTNNLSDVASPSTAAANLGLPALTGPPGMNLVIPGDSITEGLHGSTNYAAANYPAVVQGGPWGSGGSLVYAMGFAGETTSQIYGHYNQGAASTTITTTAGSTSATVASGAGISAGNAIAFKGSVPGTTVTAISGTTVTLSAAPTSSQSGVTCALNSVPVGDYYGGYYGGGAANGWVNFMGTGHGLSYAVTGMPTLDLLYLLGNDYYENIVTTTITTTASSTSATLGSATSVSVGSRIETTGVPQGTYVTAISGTTITMSAPATLTQSTVTANLTVVFQVTGTLTSGSAVVTGLTGSYASIVHGSILTGTGLPSGSNALWVVSGQGTTSVTLSGNATASGTVTLTVHSSINALDGCVSNAQAFVTACHADGNTTANGGGVIIPLLIPQASNSRTDLSDAFRQLFNSVISGGTLGQDYTFNPLPAWPTSASLVANNGSPYFDSGGLHFTPAGAALYGQTLGQYLLTITKSTNTGGSAVPFASLSLGSGQLIWVSALFGSDSPRFGSKYSIACPFQTATAALAVAKSGDTIVVQDGGVTLGNSSGGAVWPNGVSMFLMPGVGIGGGITDGGATVTGTITGSGQTDGNGFLNSYCLSFTGTSSSFTFNNLNLSASNASPCIVLNGPSEIVTVNGNVSASGDNGINIAPGGSGTVTVNGNVYTNAGGNAYKAAVFMSGATPAAASLVTVNGTASATGGGSYDQVIYVQYNGNKVVVHGDAQWLGTNTSGAGALYLSGSTNTVIITGTASSANTNGSPTVVTTANTDTVTLGNLMETSNYPSSLGASSSYVADAAQGIKTVSGSTSGTATFSEPIRRTDDKKVLFNCIAFLGSGTYTLPTAMTSSSPIVSAPTGVTVTTATGSIVISTTGAVSGVGSVEAP